MRWLAVLGLMIGNWVIVSTAHTFGAWLPVIIIAVVLLLPDVHSIAFGGVELELRRTKEEVAELQGKVNVLQQVTTNIYPVDVAAAINAAIAGATREQVEERAAAAVAPSEEAGTPASDAAPPAPEEFV